MATPRPQLRGSLVAPGVRWDEAARRYRDRSGLFLSDATVRAVMEAEIENTERRALEAAAKYRRTGKKLQFQRSMETLTRRANQVGAAIGRGGFAQLSRADKDWIRDRVRVQFDALQGFLRDLDKVKPEDLDGRFEARVRAYIRASRSSEREMVTRMARQRGARLFMRVLGRADHCQRSKTRPGCVEVAGKPVPEGKRTPHGSCTCLYNCHCYEVTDLDVERIPKAYRARMERAVARLSASA